jgi:uncharacterized protein YuzE
MYKEKMKKADITYNEEEDILNLSNGAKAKYSVGIDDLFIADFDAKDKIVGVEILDASEVIYGISKKILKNITLAKFGVRRSKGLLVIGILIKSDLLPEPIRSSIPIQVATRAA